MATKHAEPGEIVDLGSWAQDLPEEKSKAIAKTARLELARLVIDAGKDMHESGFCHVSGPIVVHCLEGEIELETREKKIRISEGQLTYLPGEAEHAIRGILRSTVLLTIVL